MSEPGADRTGTLAPLVRDYLVLGLRLGRHVDGFVDCWFGDRAISARVAAEPPVSPLVLAAQARRLGAELAEAELDESRRRFLAAQLTAMAATADRLAGRERSFVVEVQDYFDVHIVLGDPDRYACLHDTMAELLPGPGDLGARLEAFYDRNAIPPDKLARAVRAVSDELRARARSLFGLPPSERVDYEVVRDRPWNAFNTYLGDFRSKVALNAESGRAIAALPTMVTHESYPGHHTDHCLKEAGLVRERGHDEQLISLVNTPQCLIAEGAGELAVAAILGEGWGAWTAEILSAEGIRSDGELVERVLAVFAQLLPARQDAAILLHDRGADPDEVLAFLRRWLLLPPDRAEHMMSFLTDPLWRAYTVTYIEGARLVRAWLGARPAGQPVADRYLALLREPVLPSDLQADLQDRVEVHPRERGPH